MAPYKVHKQGFLQLAPLGVAKKQGQRKKWRRYWFILIEDPKQVGLVCFKSEKDFISRSKHTGFIRVDDCNSYHVMTDPRPQYINSLAIEKKQLRYLLGCETRYELHEWLAAIHQTMEEFKKKKAALTVGTQTGMDSGFEDPQGEMWLGSSRSPPSSESDRHSEGPMNGNVLSDSEGQTSGNQAQNKRESWGPGYLGNHNNSHRDDNMEERRPIRRRRSRSLPQNNRNSRNLSPPRDPPPPPPADLHMSRDHLPDMSDDEGQGREVRNAVDQAFTSIDSNGRRDREGDRRASFTTFKPANMSQPIFNTWHRGTSISEARRRSATVSENPKLVPVAASIPLPHMGKKNHEPVGRKPSVYSDDFVDSHPSPLPVHRRKMSAPANIILSDLPQLPPRKKSSESHSMLVENLVSPPAPDPKSPSDQSPPPLPPHEPIVQSKQPLSGPFSERQPSLRQMTSKNFLSHLTAVTPYNKPQLKQPENKDQHVPTPPETRTPVMSPNESESNNEDEFTKFSVSEIKRRLFGEGSGSPIASKESFRPVVKAQSQGNSSVEEHLKDQPNETDGPQVQQIPPPVPPLESRVIENPNYSSHMIAPLIPKSSSTTFGSHDGLNGYHEQNGHISNHTSRPPWMASSQTLNDFRLSSDRSFFHSNQRRQLQQEDRAYSSSTLRMRGKITDLDAEIFQRPVSAMPRPAPRHHPGQLSNPSTTHRGNQPHMKSPPRSHPPVTSTSRSQAVSPSRNHQKTLSPSRSQPHIATPGKGHPQLTSTHSQPSGISPLPPNPSVPGYRDPKRAPRRNRPPVQDRPGRTTPNGMRKASVFDTTVEWDESANQTILRSLC